MMMMRFARTMGVRGFNPVIEMPRVGVALS